MQVLRAIHACGGDDDNRDRCQSCSALLRVCARTTMVCRAGRSSSGSSKDLPSTPSKTEVKQGNLDGYELDGFQVQLQFLEESAHANSREREAVY